VEERKLNLESGSNELDRVYEPIADDIVKLNHFLEEEFSSPEPFIHELLTHIAQYHGKQIRPACLLLAGRSHGEVTHDHIKCAGVVELIHTATLVHDDVLDDAVLRRRVKTVNAHWGDRAAVLLGDYIYSRGFSISTQVEGVSGLLADTTHEICAGELLQVRSAFDATLTEERYLEIIQKKTAILYGMACRVGGQLSGASESERRGLEEAGINLGMAFQISDDALDLMGDERRVGKSLGTDLKMGKLTLPLIRLREVLQGGKLEEYRWLLERPNEIGTEHRVRHMVEQFDVLPGVRATAASYLDRAVEIIDGLSGEAIREPFRALATFILNRHH
jgi:octaprenyl-diphosphate synthase